MRTNYILIDYENVQPTAVTGLHQEHFKILVFVGASQSKVSLEVALALQRMGPRAEYIKIVGNGPNALDFHIAFYIGKLIATDANAYFHIISKDTGFDPLIQHLREQKILVSRHQDINDIPLIKAPAPQTASTVPTAPTVKTTATSEKAAAKPLSAKAALVVSDLQKRGAAKPRSVKTLSSTINAVFQKQLSEAEVAALLRELQKQNIITINDTSVSYPALPLRTP